MTHQEIKIDFDSHREQVNRMTVTQLNAVADAVLALNALDDESFALLCDVLDNPDFVVQLRKAAALKSPEPSA